MATWVEDIIQALKNLGGEARLTQIYDEVKRIRTEPLPRTYDASIRGVLERHSPDSESFTGKDLFRKVGFGVWALNHTDSVINAPKTNRPEHVQVQQIKPTISYQDLYDQPKTWVQDIIQALKNLGGEAHRKQIIEEVREIRLGPLPLRVEEIVQRTIQSHSSDSKGFNGKDIFQKVGNGVWALRDINVDNHEVVRQYTPPSLKSKRIQSSGPTRFKESLDEIENIHNTIQQYREYADPETSDWEDYLEDLFSVFGFAVKEHMRIPNGVGKEFPLWFISPMVNPNVYVAILGVIKASYPLDEFLPNVPLSIILNTFRSIEANKNNDVFWVIIADGCRMRVLDYRKSKVGKIYYENLNLDDSITQEFSTSFVRFYETISIIRKTILW